MWAASWDVENQQTAVGERKTAPLGTAASRRSLARKLWHMRHSVPSGSARQQRRAHHRTVRRPSRSRPPLRCHALLDAALVSHVSTSCSALLQLGCVCAAVVALSRAGRLDPVPLGAACSSLSYWLLLPCFGATRTASALASGGASSLAIPLLAAAQVLAGGALGARFSAPKA